MPSVVPRDEAIARIYAERNPDVPCLVCTLRDGTAGPRYVLAESRHTLTVLTRYPRRWGHALVLLRDHVTSFSSVSRDAWADISHEAHRVARGIERALSPKRCYVASLGAVDDALPMTSSHLHVHVIPIYDASDRPGTVLRWDDGVLDAERDEWQKLQTRLFHAIARERE
jgi:diadenosine tetraphosphate (Ap4A) HIT family hydrolase